MNKFLRYLFFGFFVKPVIFFLLGVSTHHRERLPKKGPAIIVANHNSHLDTLILMSLYPLRLLPQLHPVAAADYFLRNRFLAWFSKNIIGIIPIERKRTNTEEHPLKDVFDILNQNGIVIFFPEGTRGEPEKITKFKSGIAHIASEYPTLDIVPVFLYGAGKALPKGEALLVPFVVDVQIGESVRWNGDKRAFIEHLEKIFADFVAHSKSMHEFE